MALPATCDFANSAGDDIALHYTFTAVTGLIVGDSGAFRAGSSDTEECYRWNADTFADNQYSQTTVGATLNYEEKAGPAVRISSSAVTYYGYYGDVRATSARYIFKVVGGNKTVLGNTSTTALTTGDVLRLEISGTTLTAKINGSVDTAVGTSGTYTDSDISSGSAGIVAYGNSAVQEAWGDNWEGGNLAGAVDVPVTASDDLNA